MSQPASPAGWLPGLERLDAYWGEYDRRFAPGFATLPDILVIHSAGAGNWPAEFLHDPLCKPGKGRLCSDGKYRAVAAAHICFYQGVVSKLRKGTHPPLNAMRFVQCASLLHSVPHCGGSVCLGDEYPNKRSIGVELPGGHNSHDLFQAMLDELLADDAARGLRYWTMHKIIDPDHKVDPVPGSRFAPDWMDGRNLKFVGREV